MRTGRGTLTYQFGRLSNLPSILRLKRALNVDQQAAFARVVGPHEHNHLGRLMALIVIDGGVIKGSLVGASTSTTSRARFDGVVHLNPQALVVAPKWLPAGHYKSLAVGPRSKNLVNSLRDWWAM